MTLPAVESWAVRGVDGPAFKVGPRCSNPSCSQWAEWPHRVHAHHLVRRSQLQGAYDWIEVEGKVYGNKVALCPACHDDITGRLGGHRAAIRLLGDGIFRWYSVGNDENDLTLVGALDPQPPTPEATSPSGHGETDACPFCGQVKRRRSALRTAGRRRRRSWTIQVPDDAAENGAEALDALVEDIALLLGIEPNATGRYYVVLPALYYAVQDRKSFVESLKGRG